MTLSNATLPRQSGPGGSGNEGALCIPQSLSITGTLSLDLVSYLGHSLGGGLTSLQRCIQCILPPQQTGQMLHEEESLMVKSYGFSWVNVCRKSYLEEVSVYLSIYLYSFVYFSLCLLNKNTCRYMNNVV